MIIIVLEDEEQITLNRIAGVSDCNGCCFIKQIIVISTVLNICLLYSVESCLLHKEGLCYYLQVF